MFLFPLFVLFSFFFVLWSCRFSYVSCIAFSAFIFASLFSLRLGGGLCYSVIPSWRHPPPALLSSLKYASSLCVLSSFLRCWCWLLFSFFFFLLFLPFFDFDLDIVCSILSFRCGYLALCWLLGFGFCCDSFSIWYVSWYARTLISPVYFCLKPVTIETLVSIKSRISKIPAKRFLYRPLWAQIFEKKFQTFQKPRKQ